MITETTLESEKHHRVSGLRVDAPRRDPSSQLSDARALIHTASVDFECLSREMEEE